MSNFQSAQFIAYHVPTFKNVNPGTVDANSAVGKGLPADEQALVQRFAGVVNLAKTLPEVDSSPQTLKVFIAPEFYFKSQGQHWGSFQINSMINVLDALKTATTVGPDWLVIAGTVVFFLPAGVDKLANGTTIQTKDYKHTDGTPIAANESAYLNMAPIVNGTAPLNYVFKHLVSHIDGPPQDRAASLLNTFQPLLQNWAERKQRLFTVGNRTIGFEVCLDHYDKELKKVCDEYPSQEPTKTPAPPIDLHLVTSCGTTGVQYAQAKEKGYVFLCDGLGYGSEGGSEMRQVKNGVPTAPLPALARHDVPANLTVTAKAPDTLAWYGSTAKQQVVVYKPAVLA